MSLRRDWRNDQEEGYEQMLIPLFIPAIQRYLERSDGLTQAIAAERLDVIAAVEGRGVGNRATAEAAARLPERGVFALLKPIAHVGEDAANVLDAVNVQRGGHHGDAGTGHDALQNILGRVNAA